MSDAEVLVEHKDANKSFTLNARDLADVHHLATVQGKDPVMIVLFANGIEAEISIRRRRRA